MSMSATGALIWFVTTTVALVAVVALGIWAAQHSYERARGPIHFHLWHRRG